MRITFPSNVNSDFPGYFFLLELQNTVSNLFFETIFFDFEKCKFIGANLLAILGAIINKNVESNINNIEIVNLSQILKALLQRNHFLSHFGGYKITDWYETTIKYKKFARHDAKIFAEYIDKELLSKNLMPGMSIILKKQINKSISEVFSNSVIHADCQNIFTCGQCYPNKKKLDFTVVDMGVSIPQKINSHFDWQINGAKAISWAVEEGNTTKNGNIPGGSGLSLIREFLRFNKGRIQIVSGDGYWEQNVYNEILLESFELGFPGTIVNFEINLEDEAFYYLENEVDLDEIF